MTDKQRDELLVRLDERLKAVEDKLDNHIKHSWVLIAALAGALFMSACSILIFITKAKAFY